MRKSIIAIFLTLALLICAIPAMAENSADSAIVEISDGAVNDFDGDDTSETLRFTPADPDENDEINGFTIAIGDQSYTVDDAWNLAGTIYAVNLGRGMYYNPEMCWGTLFMVPEYGPSDDPYTYCYLYTNGNLFDVGAIPSLPEGMTADADGRITCHIRADHIGTWSRFAEYKLANGYDWSGDDDYKQFCHLCEIPQYAYAMGMIVTLQSDLPLKATRTDDEATLTLEGDQQVILAASDDVRWLYVTNMDGSIGGWVEFDGSDYPEQINVNGSYTPIDDVFANILYAD